MLLETEAFAPSKPRMVVSNSTSARRMRAHASRSHLLVAIGRPLNTDSLDLDAAGVRTDNAASSKWTSGWRPSAWGIRPGRREGWTRLHPLSYDDFRIIKRTSWTAAMPRSPTSGPYTVYIDPQLGRVGLSEREAREQGRNFRVARMPMSHVARAMEMDETRGMMKAVVDSDTDRILGCAILGIEGGEIMSMIHIAMMGKLPYTALRDGPFAHPTLAESLNKLFAKLR